MKDDANSANVSDVKQKKNSGAFTELRCVQTEKFKTRASWHLANVNGAQTEPRRATQRHKHITGWHGENYVR